MALIVREANHHAGGLTLHDPSQLLPGGVLHAVVGAKIVNTLLNLLVTGLKRIVFRLQPLGLPQLKVVGLGSGVQKQAQGCHHGKHADNDGKPGSPQKPRPDQEPLLSGCRSACGRAATPRGGLPATQVLKGLLVKAAHLALVHRRPRPAVRRGVHVPKLALEHPVRLGLCPTVPTARTL